MDTPRECSNTESEMILWVSDVIQSQPENVWRLCTLLRLSPIELYERITAEMKRRGFGVAYR